MDSIALAILCRCLYEVLLPTQHKFTQTQLMLTPLCVGRNCLTTGIVRIN